MNTMQGTSRAPLDARGRTSPGSHSGCAPSSRKTALSPRIVRSRASSVDPEAVINAEKQYVLQTYARPDIVFTSGSGTILVDTSGREYLDFASGIAVNALGHGDPRWLKAVVEQAERLTHTSNLYHTVPQTELARRLVESSFADKVFFCNSGTEANEAAIKFARKFAKVQAGIDPYDASMSGAQRDCIVHKFVPREDDGGSGADVQGPVQDAVPTSDARCGYGAVWRPGCGGKGDPEGQDSGGVH